MARYDLENLMADIKSIMTTNLNTKLTELDAEKADSISLATVSTSQGYFLQTMDAEVANANPFVLYGIEDIETKNAGPMGIKTVTITIYLVTEEAGLEGNVTNRMYRYLRALEEVFETNWYMVQNATKISKKSLQPFELTRLNDSQPCRAVGIRLVVEV